MVDVIPIGTLVRVKDEITLRDIGNIVTGSFVWATRIERYSDRLALVIGYDKQLGTYILYFPHDNSELRHWRSEEFTAVSDLLHLYRSDNR